MKVTRIIAGVALAIGVATPAGAATEEALWPSTFTAPASNCGPWQRDSAGFCYANDLRNGLEVGMKFQATENALITGLRIYRVDPGDVRGSLWLENGTLLARQKFAAQPGHGWQDMTFDSPIMATPGSTYIASYFTPGTRYAFEYNYFSTERTVGPIIALRSLATAPNGVHCYDDAPCGQFPSEGFRDSSYWVTPLWRMPTPEEVRTWEDSGGVVPGSAAYDTTAPTVKRIAKSGSNIRITFSEPVRRSTVTRRSVLLRGVRTDLRTKGRHVVVDPRSKVRGAYRLTISEAVQDAAGNALTRPVRKTIRWR